MKNLYFVVLYCLLGFVTGCSDDDTATALLQIAPSTDLVFEAVGGTKAIEVKTDQTTWSVESNQTWCKVEKSDGTHFTVTAEENTASEPMPQAAVTVTAGTAQVVLKVDQKGAAIPPHPTDLVIQIDVTDITAHNAQLLLTPSNNNETYVAVCVLEDQINADGDENETMSTVINSFQPPVLTGVWSEALTPLMASTKYLILAFGIDEEKQTPTTKVFRYDFTTPEAVDGNITIEGFEYKFFDAEEIITKDPSYSEELAECECVAVVTMKTSMPTDKVKMWWYEAWMKDLGDEMDDAILEDLLLYDYSNNPEFMGMYYSMDETDTFCFAGVAEDDNGNLSPICYTDFFMLEKSNCAPVEEFFTLLNSKAKTSIFKTKRTSVVFENKFSRFLPVFTIFEK